MDVVDRYDIYSMGNKHMMKLSEILFEEGVRYATVSGDPLPHHVSLTKFKPYPDVSLVGKEFEVEVEGVIVDSVEQGVVAVSVKLPEGVETHTGKPAHVTVGLFEGGKPVNSGNLDYSRAQPLSLVLRVVLVNTKDNKTFGEEYTQGSSKQDLVSGNAQLVLFRESSERLKREVQPFLKMVRL